MTTSLPSQPRLIASRLQREWDRLATTPSALRIAGGWGIVDAPVEDLREVMTAVGMGVREAPPEVLAEHDEQLRRLVGIAHHDALAARVVLQRLLPGMVATARRHSRGFSAELDAFDELLTVMWTVIRSFDSERRRQHIAASLLHDGEYRAFRREGRRLLVHEWCEPATFENTATQERQEPLAELLEVARCAADRLEPGDRELLGLLVSGRTALEVAAAMDVSERTVRNRRDAMVHRLRAAVAA